MKIDDSWRTRAREGIAKVVHRQRPEMKIAEELVYLRLVRDAAADLSKCLNTDDRHDLNVYHETLERSLEAKP